MGFSLYSNRLLIKWISSLLLCVFSMTQLGYAAQANAPNTLKPISYTLDQVIQSPSKLNIPFEYASVKDMHQGTSNKLIIHIQDPHANLSGQKNLANTLDSLMQRYDIPNVLVEGASSDVSLSHVRGQLSAKDLAIASKQLLYHGIISGEEYLNLISKHRIKLQGIEDQQLYDQNLLVYKKIIQNREAALDYINTINKSITRIKNQLYPKELLAYESGQNVLMSGASPSHRIRSKKPSLVGHSPSSRGARSKRRGDLTAKLETLLKLSNQLINSLTQFPNLQKMTQLQQTEQSINFNTVNSEQTHLFDELTSLGYSNMVKEYLRTTQNQKSSHITQYLRIKQLMESAKQNGILINKYIHLIGYQEYLKAISDLNIEQLMNEFNEFENTVYEELLENQDTKKIRAINRYLNLLEKAYKIQLSNKDFELFQTNHQDFETPSVLAFLNLKSLEIGAYDAIIPHLTVLDDTKSLITEFYQLVNDRDIAFVQNTLKSFQNSESKVSFLITGGYHTEHLNQLLKQNDISYLTLTPKVTEETNHTHYEKLLFANEGSRLSNLKVTNTVRQRASRFAALNRLDVLTKAGAKLSQDSRKVVQLMTIDAGARMVERSIFNKGLAQLYGNYIFKQFGQQLKIQNYELDIRNGFPESMHIVVYPEDESFRADLERLELNSNLNRIEVPMGSIGVAEVSLIEVDGQVSLYIERMQPSYGIRRLKTLNDPRVSDYMDWNIKLRDELENMSSKLGLKRIYAKSQQLATIQNAEMGHGGGRRFYHTPYRDDYKRSKVRFKNIFNSWDDVRQRWVLEEELYRKKTFQIGGDALLWSRDIISDVSTLTIERVVVQAFPIEMKRELTEAYNLMGRDQGIDRWVVRDGMGFGDFKTWWNLKTRWKSHKELLHAGWDWALGVDSKNSPIAVNKMQIRPFFGGRIKWIIKDLMQKTIMQHIPIPELNVDLLNIIMHITPVRGIQAGDLVAASQVIAHSSDSVNLKSPVAQHAHHGVALIIDKSILDIKTPTDAMINEWIRGGKIVPFDWLRFMDDADMRARAIRISEPGQLIDSIVIDWDDIEGRNKLKRNIQLNLPGIRSFKWASEDSPDVYIKKTASGFRIKFGMEDIFVDDINEEAIVRQIRQRTKTLIDAIAPRLAAQQGLNTTPQSGARMTNNGGARVAGNFVSKWSSIAEEAMLQPLGQQHAIVAQALKIMAIDAATSNLRSQIESLLIDFNPRSNGDGVAQYSAKDLTALKLIDGIGLYLLDQSLLAKEDGQHFDKADLERLDDVIDKYNATNPQVYLDIPSLFNRSLQHFYNDNRIFADYSMQSTHLPPKYAREAVALNNFYKGIHLYGNDKADDYQEFEIIAHNLEYTFRELKKNKMTADELEATQIGLVSLSTFLMMFIGSQFGRLEGNGALVVRGGVPPELEAKIMQLVVDNIDFIEAALLEYPVSEIELMQIDEFDVLTHDKALAGMQWSYPHLAEPLLFKNLPPTKLTRTQLFLNRRNPEVIEYVNLFMNQALENMKDIHRGAGRGETFLNSDFMYLQHPVPVESGLISKVDLALVVVAALKQQMGQTRMAAQEALPGPNQLRYLDTAPKATRTVVVFGSSEEIPSVFGYDIVEHTDPSEVETYFDAQGFEDVDMVVLSYENLRRLDEHKQKVSLQTERAIQLRQKGYKGPIVLLYGDVMPDLTAMDGIDLDNSPPHITLQAANAGDVSNTIALESNARFPYLQIKHLLAEIFSLLDQGQIVDARDLVNGGILKNLGVSVDDEYQALGKAKRLLSVNSEALRQIKPQDFKNWTFVELLKAAYQKTDGSKLNILDLGSGNSPEFIEQIMESPGARSVIDAGYALDRDKLHSLSYANRYGEVQSTVITRKRGVRNNQIDAYVETLTPDKVDIAFFNAPEYIVSLSKMIREARQTGAEAIVATIHSSEWGRIQSYIDLFNAMGYQLDARSNNLTKEHPYTHYTHKSTDVLFFSLKPRMADVDIRWEEGTRGLENQLGSLALVGDAEIKEILSPFIREGVKHEISKYNITIVMNHPNRIAISVADQHFGYLFDITLKVDSSDASGRTAFLEQTTPSLSDYIIDKGVRDELTADLITNTIFKWLEKRGFDTIRLKMIDKAKDLIISMGFELEHALSEYYIFTGESNDNESDPDSMKQVDEPMYSSDTADIDLGGLIKETIAATTWIPHFIDRIEGMDSLPKELRVFSKDIDIDVDMQNWPKKQHALLQYVIGEILKNANEQTPNGDIKISLDKLDGANPGLYSVNITNKGDMADHTLFELLEQLKQFAREEKMSRVPLTGRLRVRIPGHFEILLDHMDDYNFGDSEEALLAIDELVEEEGLAAILFTHGLGRDKTAERSKRNFSGIGLGKADFVMQTQFGQKIEIDQSIPGQTTFKIKFRAEELDPKLSSPETEPARMTLIIDDRFDEGIFDAIVAVMSNEVVVENIDFLKSADMDITDDDIRFLQEMNEMRFFQWQDLEFDRVAKILGGLYVDSLRSGDGLDAYMGILSGYMPGDVEEYLRINGHELSLAGELGNHMGYVSTEFKKVFFWSRDAGSQDVLKQKARFRAALYYAYSTLRANDGFKVLADQVDLPQSIHTAPQPKSISSRLADLTVVNIMNSNLTKPIKNPTSSIPEFLDSVARMAVERVVVDFETEASQSALTYAEIAASSSYQNTLKQALLLKPIIDDLDSDSVVVDMSTGTGAAAIMLAEMLESASKKIARLVTIEINTSLARSYLTLAAHKLQKYIGTNASIIDHWVLNYDRDSRTYSKVSNVPYLKGEADLVMLMNAAHVVPVHQRESTFQGIYESMKPGGTLVVGSAGINAENRLPDNFLITDFLGAIQDEAIQIVSNDSKYVDIRERVLARHKRKLVANIKSAFLPTEFTEKEFADVIEGVGFEPIEYKTIPIEYERKVLRDFFIGIHEYNEINFPEFRNVDKDVRQTILNDAFDIVEKKVRAESVSGWWTMLVAKKPHEAKLVNQIDKTKSFSTIDGHFMSSIYYFNSEIISGRDKSEIPDLTWENIVDLYELYRGDRYNRDYLYMAEREKRLKSETLEFASEVLKRVNAMEAHDALVPEGAAWIYHYIAGYQVLVNQPGFDAVTIQRYEGQDDPLDPATSEDVAAAAEGHHRLAWLLMNYFLIRHGYEPFYFETEEEYDLIKSKVIRYSMEGEEMLEELIEDRLAKFKPARMNATQIQNGNEPLSGARMVFPSDSEIRRIILAGPIEAPDAEAIERRRAMPIFNIEIPRVDIPRYGWAAKLIGYEGRQRLDGETAPTVLTEILANTPSNLPNAALGQSLYTRNTVNELVDMAGRAFIHSVFADRSARELTSYIQGIYKDDDIRIHQALAILSNYSQIGVTDAPNIIHRLVELYEKNKSVHISETGLHSLAQGALTALMRNSQQVNNLYPEFFEDQDVINDMSDFGSLKYHIDFNNSVHTALLEALEITAAEVAGNYYFFQVAQEIKKGLESERSSARTFKVDPISIVQTTNLLKLFNQDATYPATIQFIRNTATESARMTRIELMRVFYRNVIRRNLPSIEDAKAKLAISETKAKNFEYVLRNLPIILELVANRFYEEASQLGVDAGFINSYLQGGRILGKSFKETKASRAAITSLGDITGIDIFFTVEQRQVQPRGLLELDQLLAKVFYDLIEEEDLPILLSEEMTEYASNQGSVLASQVQDIYINGELHRIKDKVQIDTVGIKPVVEDGFVYQSGPNARLLISSFDPMRDDKGQLNFTFPSTTLPTRMTSRISSLNVARLALVRGSVGSTTLQYDSDTYTRIAVRDHIPYVVDESGNWEAQDVDEELVRELLLKSDSEEIDFELDDAEFEFNLKEAIVVFRQGLRVLSRLLDGGTQSFELVTDMSSFVKSMGPNLALIYELHKEQRFEGLFEQVFVGGVEEAKALSQYKQELSKRRLIDESAVDLDYFTFVSGIEVVSLDEVVSRHTTDERPDKPRIVFAGTSDTFEAAYNANEGINDFLVLVDAQGISITPTQAAKPGEVIDSLNQFVSSAILAQWSGLEEVDQNFFEDDISRYFKKIHRRAFKRNHIDDLAYATNKRIIWYAEISLPAIGSFIDHIFESFTDDIRRSIEASA